MAEITGTEQTPRHEELVSQFRLYDHAIEEWLWSAPLRRDGKQVHVVFATPDRAFSAMQLFLKDQLHEGANDLKKIPLPFMSIERGRVAFDPERFHGQLSRFRSMATSSDSTQIIGSQFPLPYDITYRIECWAKNRLVLNLYESWVLMQFDRGGYETYLSVDFTSISDVWCEKQIPFEAEGVTDNSDLEPSEGHRVLRFTLNLTGKAWILLPLDVVKSVLTIQSDMYFAGSDIDLAVVTAAQVDSSPDDFELVSTITTTDSGTVVS